MKRRHPKVDGEVRTAKKTEKIPAFFAVKMLSRSHPCVAVEHTNLNKFGNNRHGHYSILLKFSCEKSHN